MTARSRHLTRRDTFKLAGAAGLTTAAGLSSIANAGGSAAETPSPDRHWGPRPPKAGETAHVAVTATTLWVEPRTNRAGTDDPAVATPVDLDQWNTNMPDTDARKWLTGRLESQAVLGSEVIVDEIDGDWAHIVVTAQGTPRDERGYPGWVPLAHLVVDPAFAAQVRYSRLATVTALTSKLTDRPGRGRSRGPVSFDTILPVVGYPSRHGVLVAVPGARPAYLPADDVVVRHHGEKPQQPTAEDLIATGERFLGLRYLWAGVSAYGFDCSGFTYTILHHHGITVDRDAGDQMRHSGLAEVEREDLQRGDLVFFSSSPGSESIRHVAMYWGDGKIMQAPTAARSVEIMDLDEYDVDDEYAGARRVELAG